MAVYLNEMTSELVDSITLRGQFNDGELDTGHEDFDEYLKAAISWPGGTLTEVSERDLRKLFDEFLDEIHEPYEMAGMTFYPSAILKSDPIAYDLEFGYWLDGQGISTDDI